MAIFAGVFALQVWVMCSVLCFNNALHLRPTAKPRLRPTVKRAFSLGAPSGASHPACGVPEHAPDVLPDEVPDGARHHSC